MKFPDKLSPEVRNHLRDIMLRLGRSVELKFSEPFHPDGVWFIDILDPQTSNSVVFMYSKRRGYGLSFNPIEFGNDPEERLENDTVVARAVQMITDGRKARP